MCKGGSAGEAGNFARGLRHRRILGDVGALGRSKRDDHPAGSARTRAENLQYRDPVGRLEARRSPKMARRAAEGGPAGMSAVVYIPCSDLEIVTPCTCCA